MPKVRDEEVLQYLENHTYDDAMDYFKISRMTVARIKKRNMIRSEYMPEKIRVAIIGIGNAASALIQGIEYYRVGSNNAGLLRPTLAGYHISDIQIVGAIDISEKKVGKKIVDALAQNELKMISKISEPMNIKVEMGPVLDGIFEETEQLRARYNAELNDITDESQKAKEKIHHEDEMNNFITASKIPPIDVAAYLKEKGTEIVLCLLPSGADEAVKFYANEALKASCAFINATPTSIANNKDLAKKFKDANLPLIGDDLQDQFGATIVHKMILQQMLDRGIDIKESYALDVGGGAESLNTIYRARDVKRTIKSMSVAESLNMNAPITAGTSDYVGHMGNSRNSLLWIVGKGYLGSEIIMDIKIQTMDGPNGGPILADVIRSTKVALNQGASGPVDEISSYGFKNPPTRPKSPAEASQKLANFILGVK